MRRIVGRVDNECHVVIRVVLVENRPDILFKFRIDSLAGAKDGNALVVVAWFRPERPHVAGGADAVQKCDETLKNCEKTQYHRFN